MIVPTYCTAQLLKFHDTMNKVSPPCAFSNVKFAFETIGGPEVNKATYEYHYPCAASHDYDCYPVTIN